MAIKIAAVDFDGTVVENAWPEVGKLRPDAREGLQFLKDRGFSIVIWTVRGGDRLQQAKDFLDKERLPYDFVNENDPRVESFMDRLPYPKIFASMYIDDSAWPPFPGWRFLIENFDRLGMPKEFDFDSFFSDAFWEI